VHNHTTFTFVPQGWLGTSVPELMVRKEGHSREEARRRVEEWFQGEVEGEAREEVGEPGQPRSGVARTGRCRRCQSRLRADFRRNGHYRRRLLVLEGQISVRVPLVRCKCGGYVDIEWRILVKGARVWFDVRLAMVRHYLAGMSYRKTADAVSSRGAAHISHLAGWRAMQKAGFAGRKPPVITECPGIVILDEMYVWVAGKKRVFLLVIDCRGRILGCAGPTARSVEEWRKLLEALSERGVSPERGLKNVVADGDISIQEAVRLVWGQVGIQDCVWHILARVREQASEAYGNRSPLVSQIVHEARGVLMHDTRTQETRAAAAGKLAEFSNKHEGRPWVNTVARTFARATAYLQSPSLPRTNGTAERTIKETRRRVKTMDGFRSLEGAMNFMAVFMQCHNGLRESALTHARLSQQANLKVQPFHPKPA
jgi:transposase-like protein